MVSANTLCKKLLNVKSAVVEGCDFYSDQDGVNHIRIHARPNRWHENDCPFCHKRCKRYDQKNAQPRTWRGLDWGGTFVDVSYDTHRIECPEHGVLVADVPWAYPNSGKAYGFRNIQNMLDMVYLVCSDLRVPLPNRKPMRAKSA